MDNRSISRPTVGHSRRDFIRLGGVVLGATSLSGFLTACAAENAEESVATAAPAPTSTPTESTTPVGTPASTPSEGAVTLEGTARTVRSTDVSWLWAPYLVAEQVGFFEEEGLDQSGQAIGQGEVAGLVVGGDAEFIIGSPVGPMKTTLAGQPLTTFAAMVTTYASNIVITGEAFEAAGLTDSSSNEERGAALQGLRMATTGPGAGPDLLIRFVASELGGLDPESDVTLVPVQGGGGPILAAVENGQVDGFCLSSPTSDQGVNDFGMRYLFNMAEDPIPELVDYLYIVASCRPDYLESNRDHVLAYCRALQRSLQFIAEQPQEFRSVMEELFEGVAPEIFDAGFEANKSIYGSSIVPTQAQFEQVKQFLALSFEVQNQDPSAAEALTFDEVFNADIATEALDAVN